MNIAPEKVIAGIYGDLCLLREDPAVQYSPAMDLSILSAELVNLHPVDFHCCLTADLLVETSREEYIHRNLRYI